MVKKQKGVKCEKCNLEFSESELSEEHKDKAFVWDGKILCKDCLAMLGGNESTALTLWDFQKEQKAKRHDW